MASKLNPGADATLVGVAYRAAMANMPADYSDTLERAADSYEKTMEAQSKAWGNIAKLGAKIGVDMVANAKELSEYQALASGLNPEVHDMFYNELNEIKDAQKEIGFLNFTREGRKRRAELKIKQKERFAEIDLAIESLALGTEAVASGAYDSSINEAESEMVNAIIKSNLKDKVTEQNNIARLTRDENSGELLYTMYDVSTNPDGDIAMLNGVPQTMTIKQFNKSIATNADDKGAMQANVGAYNTQRADAGLQSRDGVYDPQMKQMDLNYLDTIIQTPAGLKRAFKTKIGYSGTTFFDDLNTRGSQVSLDLYNTLLSVTGDGEEIPLDKLSKFSGITQSIDKKGNEITMEDTDGSGGISQAELTNANNYAILSGNILAMKDPKVSEAYFKEYASKKLEESFKYGYSKKAPVAGGGSGVKTDKNPYGIPEKGLLLGPLNRYDKQIPVRQDLVIDYIKDIETGNNFIFYSADSGENEYSYDGNNWYENKGIVEKERKFDSVKQMTDDVFITGGKYFNGLETVVEIDPITGKAVYTPPIAAPSGTKSSFSPSVDMNFMDRDDNAVAGGLQDKMPAAFSGKNPNGYKFMNLKRTTVLGKFLGVGDYSENAVGLYDDDENIITYPKGHKKDVDNEGNPGKGEVPVIIYTGGDKERRMKAIADLDDILNTEQFKIKGFGNVNSSSSGGADGIIN